MLSNAKVLWKRNWELLEGGYGFFIFLELTIGGILSYTLVQIYPQLTLFQVIVFIVSSIAHLILHWFSSLFFETPRGNFVLLVSQSILGFIIVMLVGRFELIYAVFAAMIGTVSGTGLSLRIKALSIFWYAALLSYSAYLFSETGFLDQWWAAILSTTFIIFIFAIAFDMQNRARAHSEKLLSDLGEAHTDLANYAERIETLTLENERQRIARELHDTLAQGLAGLILNLEAISSQVERKNEARAQEILQQSMTDARSTLAEARQVIDDLRSIERGETDFETQLKVAVAHFETAARVPCEVSVTAGLKLDDDLQKQILRIVKEALNNVMKHAKAEKVLLRFAANDDGYVLHIEDNGRGFIPKVALQKEGRYGLLGIQERVTLLGGTAEINSQPGIGTKIMILIPVEYSHE